MNPYVFNVLTDGMVKEALPSLPSWGRTKQFLGHLNPRNKPYRYPTDEERAAVRESWDAAMKERKATVNRLHEEGVGDFEKHPEFLEAKAKDEKAEKAFNAVYDVDSYEVEQMNKMRAKDRRIGGIAGMATAGAAALGGGTLLARRAMNSRSAQQALRRNLMVGGGAGAAALGGGAYLATRD